MNDWLQPKQRPEDIIFCLYNLVVYLYPIITALHRGLSKYLTAQDTYFSPISSKHNRTMSSHGSLLSLQSWSTIQVNRFFFNHYYKEEKKRKKIYIYIKNYWSDIRLPWLDIALLWLDGVWLMLGRSNEWEMNDLKVFPLILVKLYWNFRYVCL